MTYIYQNDTSDDLFDAGFYLRGLNANFRREMDHLIADIRSRLKVGHFMQFCRGISGLV